MEMIKSTCAGFFIFAILFKAFSAQDHDVVSWDCNPSNQDDTCNVQRTNPNNLRCGLFKKYNPRTTPTLPEIKGVAGGVTFDGKTQYVGFGSNYCGYPAQIPCPAYIQTDSPAGAYMFCNNNTNFDDTEAFYLVNHSDLNWVDTDNTRIKSIPSLLKITGLFYNFAIGRVLIRGQYRLGKIHLNRISLGLRLRNERGRGIVFNSNYQVLTCLRCENNGTGQYCCTNGADNPYCCTNGGYGRNCTIPCGHQLFLKDNNPDDPKTQGFDSGKFIDGSIVYPGTGFFAAWDSTDVARIQTVKRLKGPGAYIGWESKYYFDGERARYFVPHPKLRWISTTIALATNVTGALQNYLRVQYQEFEGVDYFARVNITTRNGTYQQIGYLMDNQVCFWNGTFARCDKTPSRKVDILACVP